MNARVGLDAEKKKCIPLLGIEPQFLGRLARCPMQYLLSYPGSIIVYR
jgi:hypothetical protein